MAATRIIPMHIQKHSSVSQCLKARTAYAMNGAKTNNGEFISAYECNPEIIDKEFEFSKSQYSLITGRRILSNEVIAYQIRQSFAPGEITPEEANRLGYETAMRWTKGKHAFIVATHIDKAHIHNHIVYNSTTLDCKHKYRNFFFSSMALQKVSDRVCMENGYSIIEPKPYDQREKRTVYPHKKSQRDKLRELIIDLVKEKEIKELEELLRQLEELGFQIKIGKHIAIKNDEMSRFVRLSFLGEGFEEGDFDKILGNEHDRVSESSVEKSGYSYRREIKKMVDVQDIIMSHRGPGYENWAKVHNVKQLANGLCFMKEHNIDTFEDLNRIATEMSDKQRQRVETSNECAARLKEIKELKTHIINYVKSNEVYAQYKKGGYKPDFFEEHRAELTLRKAARNAFQKLEGPIPKIKELNEEYKQILLKKKVAERLYYEDKQYARDLATVNYNMKKFIDDYEKDPLDDQKEMSRKKKRDENSL